MKKIIAMLLALVMVLSLAACGGTGDGNKPKEIKIGVLVADVSGEEALAFRNYYEKYLAPHYGVTLTYTEQLEDAAAEKAAIETFAAQGYNAIISLSASDRASQLETCAQYGMYYAIASGMDDALYAEHKSNEYFVGQIGPSMTTEYEAGVAMGKYFKEQGVKKIGIYGAFVPNPMHVYRLAGTLVGLGLSYNGATEMEAIAGQLYAGFDLNAVAGDIAVTHYIAGYSDTMWDELGAAMGAGIDAFISVGMATTFFADMLNGAKLPYSDIDSFTSGNGKNVKEGSLKYLAGKYASSVGPIFAAVINAVNGNAIRTPEGYALSISQSYLVATDAASFDACYGADQGDKPIISTETLDTVIGEDVTYEQFVAIVK
ncbi:MAG: sugar ABC transporter substrate-binding protein [Ruminococcaceae bacterium]|nr:sugar ABC transporter substrate-binding protein [Oscillospiraceae bacterium]